MLDDISPVVDVEKQVVIRNTEPGQGYEIDQAQYDKNDSANASALLCGLLHVLMYGMLHRLRFG
jgi:hypothetical protein